MFGSFHNRLRNALVGYSSSDTTAVIAGTSQRTRAAKSGVSKWITFRRHPVIGIVTATAVSLSRDFSDLPHETTDFPERRRANWHASVKSDDASKRREKWAAEHLLRRIQRRFGLERTPRDCVLPGKLRLVRPIDGPVNSRCRGVVQG